MAVFFTGLHSPFADAAEPGSGELTTVQRGITLSVFTYLPEGCEPQGLLFVFPRSEPKCRRLSQLRPPVRPPILPERLRATI